MMEVANPLGVVGVVSGDSRIKLMRTWPLTRHERSSDAPTEPDGQIHLVDKLLDLPIRATLTPTACTGHQMMEVANPLGVVGVVSGDRGS
jgi:hypothetical protein